MLLMLWCLCMVPTLWRNRSQKWGCCLACMSYVAIWCAYLQDGAQHLMPLEDFLSLQAGYVSAPPALTCTACVSLKIPKSGYKSLRGSWSVIYFLPNVGNTQHPSTGIDRELHYMAKSLWTSCLTPSFP